MKVRFSYAAEADLEAIAEWIAADDPMRAASFVAELGERCLSLANRPNRFPVARRVGGHVFRKLVHRDYLIFYRVLPERVEIEHVLHGARNWAALLGEGS